MAQSPLADFPLECGHKVFQTEWLKAHTDETGRKGVAKALGVSEKDVAKAYAYLDGFGLAGNLPSLKNAKRGGKSVDLNTEIENNMSVYRKWAKDTGQKLADVVANARKALQQKRDKAAEYRKRQAEKAAAEKIAAENAAEIEKALTDDAENAA